MKNFHSSLVILGLAVATFSSCSRGNYDFDNKASAYRAAAVRPIPTVAAPAAIVLAQPIAGVTYPAAPGATPLGAAPKVAPVVRPALAAASPASPAPAKAAKPNFVQRLALNKVLKQVTKSGVRQQNTASASKTTASRAGSITLVLLGLAALVVGLIISSTFVTVAGGVVFVIGLVLFFLKSL